MYAGLLLEREVTELTRVVESPQRPLVVVLGGAKVSDKVGVIDRFLEVADEILIGGAMCLASSAPGGSAPAAAGRGGGVALAAEALERAGSSDCELSCPSTSFSARASTRHARYGRARGRGARRLDGARHRPAQRPRLCAAIASAGTVLWNGPMGAFELEPFAAGTRTVAKAVAAAPGTTVVGGGDPSPPCSSSGSVTRWTGSRPEEEHRWSCWRERSCRAWRRCHDADASARRYIAANWKMHKTVAEAAEFVDALLPRIAATQRDVVICPPFTALSAVVERRYGTAVKVAAQNMHEEDSGAFTGEVSAPMLVELDVEAVVLGHSERRQFFGETDEALARKVPAALAAGLEPILCVGESEEARDGGETEAVLERQLQADLLGWSGEPARS